MIQMRNPLQAVLWELWRTSRLQLLTILALQFFFVIIFYFMSRFSADMDGAGMRVICGIFVVYATTAAAFSQSWRNSFDNSQIGFSFRLGFTRPISTFQLVGVPMLFVMFMGPVCYLVPAGFFSLLLGLRVPLVAPALITMCIVACLLAVAWCPTTIIGKAIGLVTFFIALIASVAGFHILREHPDPWVMAIGKLDYFNFVWYHYVLLLSAPLISLAFTVIAVDKQRHGDRLEPGNLFRNFSGNRPRDRNIASSFETSQPFRGVIAAQCWYEMRRFGKQLLIIGFLAPLIPLGLVTFISIANPLFRGIPWIWIIAIGFCPFVYQIIGSDGAVKLRQKQGGLQFSKFDATCPMRNDHLMAIKLLVIAACSLVAWIWMGLVAFGHAAVSDCWTDWVALGQMFSASVGSVPDHFWIAIGISGVLIYTSSSSFLLAAGIWLATRPLFLSLIALAGLTHIVIGLWDHQHDWRLLYFWVAEGWMLALAIVAGSVYVLFKAIHSEFLGGRMFVFVLCLWIGYVVTNVTIFINSVPDVSIPITILALGSASLLIPLAATAAAPLALAGCRHR